jgi:hypothetical protein
MGNELKVEIQEEGLDVTERRVFGQGHVSIVPAARLLRPKPEMGYVRSAVITLLLTS